MPEYFNFQPKRAKDKPLFETRCSLCGVIYNRWKRVYPTISKHFEEALYVWCPMNRCKEKYPRVVPEGYILKWWYDYDGWYTVGKRQPLTPEQQMHAERAKDILRRGLEQLHQQALSKYEPVRRPKVPDTLQ